MGDGHRVPELVAVGPDRGGAVELAEDEALLEPTHVADLPEEGVDDLHLRPEEVLLSQPGDQGQGGGAGVPDLGDDLVGSGWGRVGGDGLVSEHGRSIENPALPRGVDGVRARALLQRATTLMDLGRFAEALPLLEERLELPPGDSRVERLLEAARSRSPG